MRFCVAAAITVVLGACEPSPAAQIVVTLDTDLRVASELTAVVVRTSSCGVARGERRFALDGSPGARTLPGSFGIAPSNPDAPCAVTVEIDALQGSCRLFTYRRTYEYDASGVVDAHVFLARACAGNAAHGLCSPRDTCGSDALTCERDGACVPVRASPSTSDAGATLPVRPTLVPTQGAAIAISPDDRIAVAAMRRSSAVSVFDLDLDTQPLSARSVSRRWTQLPPNADAAGRDPEAWAVVLGNDGNSAFIVLRREQRVVRLDDLRGTPHFAAVSAPTGSEPTGLAIAPSGRHLYVTNFAEGTVSVVATATMHVEMTIDLNGVLARSGRLGPNVAGRPGLAHPRAVVISNDGDASDDDEVAYVTEFYAQARSATEVTSNGRTLDPAVDAGFWDRARVGLVYRVPLATNVADDRPITLDPVDDTGFADAAGHPTGCFPNQLYAAALSGSRLYVTAICASPAGPLGEVCRSPAGCPLPIDESSINPGNFQTMSHASLFSLDVSGATPGAAKPYVLTRLFRDFFDAAPASPPRALVGGAVPEALRRMPLLPIGLAFVPGDYVAYVLGYGSDGVFRVRFDRDGTVDQVGSSDPRERGFIDLTPDAARASRLPIGIAIGHQAEAGHNHVALVLGADAPDVSVVTLSLQGVVAAVPATDGAARTPDAQIAHDGRRFFVTGTGRMSWLGQSWNSCESCHPDGLSDGVTWFFGRGPRQTPSLDGSFALDGTHRRQRLFGWNASFDEVQDVETVIRNVQGGVGGAVVRDATPPHTADRIGFGSDAPTLLDGSQTRTSQAGLNGAMRSVSSPGASGGVRSAVDDLDRLEAFVQTIRSPRAPVGLDRSDVEAGRTLFGRSCAGCHGSALWTVSRRFYEPSEPNDATAGLLRTLRYALGGFPAGLNPDAVGGSAAFRFPDPARPSDNDRMQCAARFVGTFPATPTDPAVVPPGVLVREVRQDMTQPAQGISGFNVPPTIGLALSAPYFHAGNARTLEEVFDRSFRAHHQWTPNDYDQSPEGQVQIRQIVAYLLSIDDDEPSHAIAVPNISFPLDLCAQWPGTQP